MNQLFAPGAKKPSNHFAALQAYKKPVAKEDDENITEILLFESMNPNLMLEAVEKTADIILRSDAASAVIAWINSGDSEADSFDAMAYGLAGGDSEELSDDQEKDYQITLGYMTDFAILCGANAIDCQGLVDGDDDASENVFDAVESSIQNASEDELISDFAHREKLIFESTKKVIRDGKVVIINTSKRKRKMTAAQKAALKKAQLKSHSSAANAARKKSLHLHESKNL